MVPKLAGIARSNDVARIDTDELRRQADKLTDACRVLDASPRHKELRARLHAETLTRPEQKELIGISDQIETLNARRIEILSELAQRQGTTVAALLKSSTPK